MHPRGAERLGKLPGLKVEIEPDSTSKLFSRLLLSVDEAQAGLSAFDLSNRLSAQKPSIAVRAIMADIGLLQVDLRRADDAPAEHVIDSIARIVGEAKAASNAPKATMPQPAANLADLALASIQRFPLPVGATK